MWFLQEDRTAAGVQWQAFPEAGMHSLQRRTLACLNNERIHRRRKSKKRFSSLDLKFLRLLIHCESLFRTYTVYSEVSVWCYSQVKYLDTEQLALSDQVYWFDLVNSPKCAEQLNCIIQGCAKTGTFATVKQKRNKTNCGESKSKNKFLQLRQMSSVFRLAHCKCKIYMKWLSCLLSSVCLSVCLSCVRSRKLSEIGAKFRYFYRKSGSPSKNMTSDFLPEVAKYRKRNLPQQQFRECASLLFRSVSDAACSKQRNSAVVYN